MYSTVFPPSKDLLPLLLQMISVHIIDPLQGGEIESTEQSLLPPSASPTGNSPSARERISGMADFCVNRITLLKRNGPRGYLPTIEEIGHTMTLPFRHQVFSVSLDAILRHPENVDLATGNPRVLTFLSEAIIALGGFESEGLFRVPGLLEEIHLLRLRLERGEYSLRGINEAATAASLFKLWFRELRDPIVPGDLYDACITSGSTQQECRAITSRMPQSSLRVLEFLVQFLRRASADEVVCKTKMTAESLAMVFAPNILRCTSRSPLVIMANSKREASFLAALIKHHHV